MSKSLIAGDVNFVNVVKVTSAKFLHSAGTISLLMTIWLGLAYTEGEDN